MMRPLLTALAVAPLVLLMSACGPKRQPAGLLDDPRTHSERGTKYYDQNQVERAGQEYALALELDKKWSPALAGQAMVLAHKGDFAQALSKADEAIVRNESLPDGWMAKGWVLGLQGRQSGNEDWAKGALGLLEKAVDRDPKRSEVWYRLGMVQLWALRFVEAGESFRTVIELDRGYTSLANEAWARLQKIERAAPGTHIGKRIAQVDSLTRAEAAALFLAELEMDRLLERTRGAQRDTLFRAPTDRVGPLADSARVATDIAGHWARGFIEDALAVGVRGLQVGPDRLFGPNRALHRGEFAFLVEDALLALLQDKSMATRYIGTPSRFVDVAASAPYFNAVCTAVDKGILAPQADGSFGAQQKVTGADALLAIRLLKELRK